MLARKIAMHVPDTVPPPNNSPAVPVPVAPISILVSALVLPLKTENDCVPQFQGSASGAAADGAVPTAKLQLLK